LVLEKDIQQSRKKRRLIGRVNLETGIIEPTDGRMLKAGRAVYATDGSFRVLQDATKTAEAVGGATAETGVGAMAEAVGGATAEAVGGAKANTFHLRYQLDSPQVKYLIS
jgi:hypothetical protein